MAVNRGRRVPGVVPTEVGGPPIVRGAPTGQRPRMRGTPGIPQDLQPTAAPVAVVSDLVLTKDQKILVTNWLMERTSEIWKAKYKLEGSASGVMKAMDEAVGEFVRTDGLKL